VTSGKLFIKLIAFVSWYTKWRWILYEYFNAAQKLQ